MIPYVRHTITAADEAAVLRALRSGTISGGAEIEAFEAELAAVCGARYVVAVASGTVGLELVYAALYPVTKFRVPAVTFVATANAGIRAGGKVEFADVDAETGLRAYSASTDGLDVFVTLGGVPVPETWPGGVIDACHGPLRHLPRTLATVFSFHPAKHVAAGEGGAVATNDIGLAQTIRRLRDHGRARFLGCVDRRGTNGRMTVLGAALARSQLQRVDEGVRVRREIAARYDAAFHAAGIRTVPHPTDSWRHLYQLLVDNRDTVRDQLAAQGVGTQVHYPMIPSQLAWPSTPPLWHEDFRFTGAYGFSRRTLSIPLFPALTEAEVQHVIDAVRTVCASEAQAA